MSEQHGNWIGGEWSSARSGFSFKVESPLLEAPREHLEWPRSGQAEVDEALAICDVGRMELRRVSAASRKDCLARLCAKLAAELDLELAELLDLEDEDLRDHAESLGRWLRGRADDESLTKFESSELIVARPDWRQLFLGFESTLAALLAGCPVLLLSDPRVPQLARALARAAESAGLARGALTVLHDDGLTTLRAALVSGRVSDVFLAGGRDELADLVEMANRVPGKVLSESAPFGAGVDSTESGPVEMRPRLIEHTVRSRVAVVRGSGGIANEADRILEAAFGRGSALDGVRAERVGLVLCSERHFSRFTAELLAQLEGLELPLIGPLGLDGSVRASLERVQERGLDEGATLIQGGVATLEGPRGSLRGARSAILSPTIFTNVEEHMQLVRDRRPAPLLCLMRVASEEAGDELAARLNAHPREE